MFTGLIQAIGRVEAVTPRGGGVALRVAADELGSDLVVGESIAINGACLTVEQAFAAGFESYAGAETMARTNLSRLRSGDCVNLERALRPVDRLGGHMVQGHVDGTGALLSRRAVGETELFEFSLPQELARYVAQKGSIAVEGVSLTVAEVRDGSFTVALIPETLNRTTLGRMQPGALVNLEVDILAKYVERLLGEAGAGDRTGITWEILLEG